VPGSNPSTARIRPRFPSAIRSSSAERQAVRAERSVPLLAQLKTRFEETLGKISRKSALAEALRYSLSRWDALTRYTTDGSTSATMPPNAPSGPWRSAAGTGPSPAPTAAATAPPPCTPSLKPPRSTASTPRRISTASSPASPITPPSASMNSSLGTSSSDHAVIPGRLQTPAAAGSFLARALAALGGAVYGFGLIAFNVMDIRGHVRGVFA
jgi:hypothetical protein